MLDTQTGELAERRLEHENGEARAFHAAHAGAARVGMEATRYSQWFKTRLAEQGHELWVGDLAEIRAALVRKQRTDSRDAYHLLDLLLKDKFPRIWTASPSERDVPQLLRHRHKLVCSRTSVRNQLHALTMGPGICRKDVDGDGPQGTQRPGSGPVGQPSEAGTAPDAGLARCPHPGFGRGGNSGSREPPRA